MYRENQAHSCEEEREREMLKQAGDDDGALRDCGGVNAMRLRLSTAAVRSRCASKRNTNGSGYRTQRMMQYFQREERRFISGFS